MANTTEVAILTAGMPAHIAAAFANKENITPKINIPQLSFRGKVWRVVIDGKENIILDKEQQPVPTVQGVILGVQEGRARSWFAHAYEDGRSQPPACWSNDGVAPEKEVADKQSDKCGTCPKAVKGSKITPSGKAVAECAQFKKIVWVPYPQVDVVQPLLVKVPQTSLWDKENSENEARGCFALDQYLDTLFHNNVRHSAAVVTRFSFDPRQSYPKLLFQVKEWVKPELATRVLELVDDPRVKALLEASAFSIAERVPETPAPGEAAETGQVAPAQAAGASPAPAQATQATQTPPAAATAPKVSKSPPPPPAKPKAAAPPAQPQAAAPATTVNGADDDGGMVIGGQPAPARAPAAAAAAAVASNVDLGGLVNQWDD